MRDIKLDAVKGVLILLIVLEHNYLLASTVFWVRPVTDSFVAGAFLILAFSREVKNLPFLAYIDKYYCYVVPFIIFVTFFSFVNAILFGGIPAGQRVFNYIMAIVIQSPYYIKQSSGFAYLWFLPCISFIFLLRFLHKKTNDAFLIPMGLATLSIGFLPESTLYKFPFSAHVAFFIYALGWLYGKFHDRLIGRNAYGVLAAIIFLLLLAIGYDFPMDLLLFAGTIPDFTQANFYYYLLILFFANPGIYCFMRLCPELPLRFFAFLGRNSIVIYVSHQVFYVGLTRFLDFSNGYIVYLATVIFAVFFSLAMSYMSVLNKIIFPESVTSAVRPLFRIKPLG
jgi:fucose 4-O-acetylase-like acetyltransferase